jgi:hypothetical protein
MGEWSFNSPLFLTSAIIEGEWRTSGSDALSLVREPHFALHRRLGRPHRLSGGFGEEKKNPLPLMVFEPRLLFSAARTLGYQCSS